MRSRSSQLLGRGAVFALAVMLVASAPGCGDDVGEELALDATAGDGVTEGDGESDAGPVDSGCTRGVGCACTADDECDSGLCHTVGTFTVCAKPCETGGKKGCDDGNPCTTGLCQPGLAADKDAKCIQSPLKNGAPCDDGNVCSSQDRCIAGVCGGDLLVCNDSNPCTTDACDKTGGCTYTAKDGAPCDDGSTCTTADACKDKACASGKAIDCDDNNPCTTDTCDAKAGCQHASTKAACDDGDACTTKDSCKGGVCVPGPAAVCDDNNPCTKDACLPASGCTVTDNDGATCNDGSVCTVGDACKGGTCLPTKDQDCDDGNPCTTDTCDHKTGCQYAKADGSACDDGTTCTTADKCKGGACKPGKLLACDDGNPCTADSCDPVKGCVAKNVDGRVCVPATNTCDTGGQCKAGACKTVKATSCNDGNPCTADTCDKLSGACVYTKIADGGACNDGNACLAKETCQKGACIGSPANCDDKNPCTVDTCDAVKGCGHAAKSGTALPCDDGNLCTISDTCTGVSCQPGKPQSCGDGNPCTDAACDPKTGCKPGSIAASCDDGNACTVGDACKDGHCKPGSAIDCDDGNACSLDSCDVKKGCQSKIADLSCSDGSVCTVGDACKNGTCLAGKTMICNDGNPCTIDVCDAKKGCVGKDNAASCNDGDVCTSNDVCSGGVCKPGSPLSCDDKNGCTKDWCDQKAGCKHADTASSCNDGNACTVGDGCKDGKCFPGPIQVCNDGNHCTTDSCDPKSGCVQKPNSLGCDDGNVCTVADKCGKGKCQPGTKTLGCNDGNVCTDDLCDAKTGCKAKLTDRLCNDGNVCTIKDACKSGKCVGGKLKSCDDNNKCTDDFCHATKGCVYVPNGPSVFKPFGDAGVKDKGQWVFAATKGDKAFDHLASGYYELANAKSGSTQTMTLFKKLDLQCTGDPVLYWDQRYYARQFYVEASTNGTTWAKLADIPSTRDHVWRETSVSLKQYKGTAVWIRFRALSAGTGYWWHIRNLRVAEKDKPPATINWTATTSCAMWRTEGPTWVCDKTLNPYELRHQGVKQLPDPNGYPNIIQLDRILDATKVKNPAISFLERHYHSNFYVDVREVGGAWEAMYTRQGSADYVWRKRTLYMPKFAGKKLQVRLRATMNSSYWGHIRNFRLLDKAKPGPLAVVAAPLALKDCKLWSFEGKAWRCDPNASVWNLSYVGDSSSVYNTNGYYHYADYQRRIDLSKLKNPELAFDERHYNGTVNFEISENGVNWIKLWQYPTGSDHVWREQRVDLTKYKAKKWYLRVNVRPGSSSYWGHFRNLRIQERPKPWPTVAYGTKIACGLFKFEGNSWACDDGNDPWMLRLKTTNVQPGTWGYDQSSFLTRWIDLTKATSPGLAMEYRRYHTNIAVDVSENGTTWKQAFGINGNADYVWRKIHVDLGAYKGKKILVRVRGRPNHYTYWGELRNIRWLDIKPAPVVKMATAKITCANWSIEGSAWKCADSGKPYHLRYDGLNTQPNPNGYPHHASTRFLLDLTGAKNPTLYFERRRNNGTFEVSVSGPVDARKTMWTDPVGYDPVWKRWAVDLSQFVGRKIHVSFDVKPHHPTYWGELRNIVLKERETVGKLPLGESPNSNDWTTEGAWVWSPKVSRWHLSGTFFGAWQGVLTNKRVDLTKAKDPVLEFRESVQTVNRAVRVSVDGFTWQNAALDSAQNDPVARRKVISLAKWKGKLIHIKFDGYPANINSWWQVFDIRIMERPAKVVVKPKTMLTEKQWEAEGLWKRATDGSWGMNVGVSGSSNHDILINYWQHLTSRVAFDISKLTTPTIVFEQRYYQTTGAVDVSADGVSWEQVWYRSGQTLPDYYNRVRIPITKFKKGGALYIRFRSHPSNQPNYWWSVRNMTVMAMPVIAKAAAGHVVGSNEWYVSGKWTWDSNNKWLQVIDTKTSRSHYATVERIYQVAKGNSAPKLELEEAWYRGRRIVEVSLDGKSWLEAYNEYNKGVKDTFVTTTIDLVPKLGGAATGATVYVRLRWYAVYTNDWWRLRKVTFK